MFIEFENQIVDLLLSPVSQDAFRSVKLSELLYEIRNNVHIEQINDVIQILHSVLDELNKFYIWKERNVCFSSFMFMTLY